MRRAQGFTLVEAVVAVVVAGVLASIAVTIFDRQIVASYKPTQSLQQAAQVASAMEAVIRDYDAFTNKTASDVSSLASKVNNFSSNYGTYCGNCTGSAATTTVGLLSDSIVVTISSPSGGTAYHVFTVQSY